MNRNSVCKCLIVWLWLIMLFNVIWFLWALSNHCPSLLHPSLDMWTLTSRRGWGGHLTLPRGHLLVLAWGCFESLKRFVETGSSLNGTIITGAIGRSYFSFTVVRKVTWLTGVNLTIGSECASRRWSTVIITTWLIPRKE